MRSPGAIDRSAGDRAGIMMTSFVATANQPLSVRFRNLFKPRDVFLHDGKSLRRFTIGAKLQMAVTAAIAFLLIWSVAATITAFNAMSGDVARMQSQVAQMQQDVDAMRVAVNARAAQLEQRTAFLNTMMAGHASAPQLFTSWRALDQLETGAASIPSARPIVTSVNFTSGYGVRSDPFRGSAAMHAGIDLAGPLGTPVYATADGVVGRSEWNSGGYGNLIELNHGQGIQTRYGHLSQRIAQPGQRVRRGQLIGLMGSTGRSTGSHLHYEVRIDGRAVNPIPFMQQPAATIAALQRPATEAVGGPAAGSR